jgi:colanic acid/amylovoran biosynthesis glycosyltransferase
MRTATKPTGRRGPFRERKSKRRRGTVLVYTAELLPYSETFVRDHVASLTRGSAILVGSKAVRGLSTEGIEIELLPNSRWARIALWLFGRSPSLDRLIETRAVVLIHAHFADAGARLAKYARRKGLPLVVTLHGSDVLRRPSWSVRDVVTRLLWHRLMRSADMFLPVSDHIALKAIARGAPPSKLHRHYLGIPLSPPGTKLHATGSPPTIVFVGRLVEKKGLTYLLDACRILADRGHPFQLRIIGDGPLLEECRAQAETLGERVTFVGRASPDQVRKELGAAQIVCMPSIEAQDGDNEGLPIVSLEAQAANLPIVAFDQGPLRECVEADVSGLLAKDRSAESLASCLARLLHDPDLRQRMGAAGRRNVEARFDIKEQSQQLEDIYEQLLASQPSSCANIAREQA